ncbi:L-ascorbate oxidase, partial [Orchesella cincta]
MESHPCFRECSSDPSTRMTCGYNFTLEYFWILSKACYDCPNVTSDCSRYDCIAADGVKRAIAVVNRIMPGPAIRVCKGDSVVVDVKNGLFGEGTAIHWHGIHMKTTPWMDGVPGVTQCPIPAGSTFRYEFDVPIGGTYYWHSHAGFQRGDGVFGSLIVREPKDKKLVIYDHDLPEHEIIIWDWLASLSLSNFLNHHHADGDNKPRGVLINGKGLPPGFFDDFSENEHIITISYGISAIEQTLQAKGKPFVPLHEVRVTQGHSYRLRLISNGVLNCPLEMSVENHTMTVIAADGFNVNPVDVHSLVIYAGERWDVVLKADQPVSSYWIKFRGLMDCDDRFTKAFQVAVLNYKGVPLGTLPKHSIRSWYEASAPSDELQLNPLNLAPGIEGKYMTAAELSSVEDDDPEIITQELADHQFYISYDFNPIDNIRFHGPHVPIRTVRKGFKLYTPQLNLISHVMPVSPFLTQPESMDEAEICNENTVQLNCSEEYCECTHMLTVDLNSIVELVLVDRGYTFDANHPFHLHGHAFRIMGMERLNRTTEPHYIKELDKLGRIPRRRMNAPIKDTVTVPDGGYTIVRFRADNPGFWFFHCHITYHVEVGMGLIFQVGNVSDMLAAPEDFPKCGNYIPPVANPPIRMYEKPKSIVPLKNGTNPHHPQYNVNGMTTSRKPTSHSHNAGRKPGKKNAGEKTASVGPSMLCFVLFLSTFFTNNIHR